LLFADAAICEISSRIEPDIVPNAIDPLSAERSHERLAFLGFEIAAGTNV
jgi:hypothetical protein